MMTLAAIHRCREDRENRSQCRCGIGSQFHNVAVSDDGQAKSIGEQSPVKASEKGGSCFQVPQTRSPNISLGMLTSIFGSNRELGKTSSNNEEWEM